MKTIKGIVVSIVTIGLLFSCRDGNSDDTKNWKHEKIAKSDIRIPEEKLPKLILDYILSNHSNKIVTKSNIENNGNYELDFDNNLELVFDSKGLLLGIDDDKANTFGDSIIPTKSLSSKIVKTIQRYFPETRIVKSERENNGQIEILLNDGNVVIFDDKEDFLGIGQELRYDGENAIIAFSEDRLQIGNSAINPAVMPSLAKNYLVSNYGSYIITAVFLKEFGDYEVTLENGVQVYFKDTGAFLNNGNAYGSDTGDNEGGIVVEIKDLPSLVLDYVNIDYPDETIIQARRRVNDRIDIDLSNGFEIYFDSNGSYLSTDENGNGDDHGTEVALETIPQAVLDTLTINYPSESISKVQLEASSHYKIFFTNKSEIYLDLDGNLIEKNRGKSQS